MHNGLLIVSISTTTVCWSSSITKLRIKFSDSCSMVIGSLDDWITAYAEFWILENPRILPGCVLCWSSFWPIRLNTNRTMICHFQRPMWREIWLAFVVESSYTTYGRWSQFSHEDLELLNKTVIVQEWILLVMLCCLYLRHDDIWIDQDHPNQQKWVCINQGWQCFFLHCILDEITHDRLLLLLQRSIAFLTTSRVILS